MDLARDPRTRLGREQRITDIEPRLIGLDWGTSRLRAYLLGAGGAVIARRQGPAGVMAGPERDFGAMLSEAIAPWTSVADGLPLIAAGMIGSSEGWVRAPYCLCPAGFDELAERLVTVDTGRHGELHVIPGVEQLGAQPNVMRGEETQIAGALALIPALRSESLLVLPGTHSKWVAVRGERIESFDTYLTGELYALLADRSILGRPARATAATDCGPAARNEAFDRGVRLARDGGPRGVMPLLFLTRSFVLNGSLDAGVSLDFLSGLLIGDEIRSAGARLESQPVALIGEPELCERYARAFALAGFSAVESIDACAPAGLWRVAAAAGLIESPAAHA